jgi:hypothetical protein
MALEIISNHHRRDLLYWDQLTESEQAEFDWMDENQQQEYEFFRYRGWTYSTADFVALNSMWSPGNPFGEPWQGYLNDTFFSGVVIYYPEDDCFSEPSVVLGTFYAGSDF